MRPVTAVVVCAMAIGVVPGSARADLLSPECQGLQRADRDQLLRRRLRQPLRDLHRGEHRRRPARRLDHVRGHRHPARRLRRPAPVRRRAGDHHAERRADDPRQGRPQPERGHVLRDRSDRQRDRVLRERYRAALFAGDEATRPASRASSPGTSAALAGATSAPGDGGPGPWSLPRDRFGALVRPAALVRRGLLRLRGLPADREVVAGGGPAFHPQMPDGSPRIRDRAALRRQPRFGHPVRAIRDSPRPPRRRAPAPSGPSRRA